MLCTNRDPNLINSLLLCAQAALLNGTVSNRDIINVLDAAQDLISLTVSNSACNEKNVIHPSKEQPAPPRANGLGTIAFRIHLARKNLGLSEADLAGMLGLIPECITDWEDGNCPVEATYVIPLATALKCDPLWLLDGRSKSTSAPLAPVNVMQGVDMSTIGKRINAARVSLGMSSGELESAVNLPSGFIAAWETGRSIPSSKHIDELAKTLETSVTWLLTGKEVEVSHE
ncbi:helix-turn-helix domain-containing protein [Citrobacter koseri]|uniref:helix-turn-helix domain-containing protein n=1 Tax=Citrobacter koseri TaxID=545 RepID=UPI0024B6C0C5|nr:helix-turn-helix domain-containing protein [Citrobacter koseri]MDI9801335.1 helix-turn-helix domain-containing protein [Citrobacter koseri]